MLVENVDLERISALLQSLPAKMEITGINLTNGYSCNLVAGEQEINNAEYAAALKRLNSILDIYEASDKLKLHS